MPIYEQQVTDADFDGTTAALGLFLPSTSTGGDSIQLRVNSISFGGSLLTSISSWTLYRHDPSDNDGEGEDFLLLTDTTSSLICSGPIGFDMVPTNLDGSVPWGYKFVTEGVAGTAKLRIDYDFVNTEG